MTHMSLEKLFTVDVPILGSSDNNYHLKNTSIGRTDCNRHHISLVIIKLFKESPGSMSQRKDVENPKAVNISLSLKNRKQLIYPS